MKLKLKHYKKNKIKKYIKSTQLFFICHGVNLTIKEWIPIQQELKTLNLNHYRLTNNLIKILLTKSIFKNLESILKGPCFFIDLSSSNNKTLLLTPHLSNLSQLLTFFCIKINNRIYTYEHLKQLKALNYLTCITNFQYFLCKYLYRILKNF
jgi:hypothetical protein